MKKRLSALLLALAFALGLTACGPTQPQASGAPSADPSASADPNASAAPEIVADLSKNIVEFSTGLSPEEVLVTVNGQEITADLFCYLLASDCNNFIYQYYSHAGSLPESLDSFADLLRDDAATMASYYTVLRQKAVELGVPLTDEQQAEASAQLDEETLAQLRGAYAFSDQSLEFITTLQAYNDNVLSTIPAPTDEELNNFVYQTKHILLLTIDQSTQQPLSDEEKAEKLSQAEDLLARLKAVEGEEREALFDELMEEYSEDGRDADGHIDADGYEATLGRMVEPYETASLALGIGEMSDIVESEYGYHIILRGEVAFRDATKEEYAEQYRSYQLDEKMDQWVEQVTTSKADAVASIDVDDFYNKYVAYQEAYAEAHPNESASPAPATPSPVPTATPSSTVTPDTSIHYSAVSPNDDDFWYAVTAAQNLVKDELKSPSTAKFSYDTSDYTVKRSGSHWIVGGYVDSQNSFGAMIRDYWTATFTMGDTDSGSTYSVKDYSVIFS